MFYNSIDATTTWVYCVYNRAMYSRLPCVCVCACTRSNGGFFFFPLFFIAWPAVKNPSRDTITTVGGGVSRFTDARKIPIYKKRRSGPPAGSHTRFRRDLVYVTKYYLLENRSHSPCCVYSIKLIFFYIIYIL